jgi:hypothetical protein
MARKPVPYRPKGPMLSPEQGLVQLQEAVRRGSNLLDLHPLPEERYDVWSQTAVAVLKAACGEGSPYIDIFVGDIRVIVTPIPEQYAEPQRRKELERRIRVLEAVIESLPATSQSQSPTTNTQAALNRKVFLVHGHQHGARETVARFLEKLELEPALSSFPARWSRSRSALI